MLPQKIPHAQEAKPRDAEVIRSFVQANNVVVSRKHCPSHDGPKQQQLFLLQGLTVSQ
jgi:hypothetical protein